MNKIAKELAKIIDDVNQLEHLDKYHKDVICQAIEFAIKSSGREPTPEQRLSNSFYQEPFSAELSAGDLLDVKLLNKELSTLHNQLNLYDGEYSSKFYPYFFENYQYACIATQDCKITHNKVRTIEICALKPLSAVACELLPRNKVKNRSKILQKNADIDKLIDEFRKLFDQQKDDLFFYHDYYQNDRLIRAASSACIDIKIPIRVIADATNSNLEAIKRARIASIQPIFRSKLCEKIARHYISVALQDSLEHFLNKDAHNEWISGKIQENFLLVKDNKIANELEAFIAECSDFNALTIEEIWNNTSFVQKIQQKKEQLEDGLLKPHDKKQSSTNHLKK